MVSREARFKRLHTERFCFEKVKTIRTALGSVTGEGRVSQEQEKIQEVMNILYYFDCVVGYMTVFVKTHRTLH